MDEDFVDEKIPRLTVNCLRDLDHDVRDIRGSADQGLVDTALRDIAVREQRHPDRSVAPAQPPQDPPISDAGIGAVRRGRMAWAAGVDARCDNEHLTRRWSR